MEKHRVISGIVQVQTHV
ncbi:unnamed protein product [Fusarium venenatum]|uniref:Uncharacterized protein n=1 Tax=Fusarium venenatum TaxID=56646 RepID=A0A2L2T646_9HYPO|nr:unnamed protein product [Fusarium venenatum]